MTDIELVDLIDLFGFFKFFRDVLTRTVFYLGMKQR